LRLDSDLDTPRIDVCGLRVTPGSKADLLRIYYKILFLLIIFLIFDFVIAGLAL